MALRKPPKAETGKPPTGRQDQLFLPPPRYARPVCAPGRRPARLLRFSASPRLIASGHHSASPVCPSCLFCTSQVLVYLLRAPPTGGIHSANRTGQTAGAPCAPRLGTASAELSIALAAQRSGSVRAASNGPPHCPRHDRRVFPFSFLLCPKSRKRFLRQLPLWFYFCLCTPVGGLPRGTTRPRLCTPVACTSQVLVYLLRAPPTGGIHSANRTGQTAGAPCAPRLGTASA
jgi:hypothetical protein